MIFHKFYYILCTLINQSLIILFPIIALNYYDKEFVAKISIYQTIIGLLFGIFAIFFIDRIKKKIYIVYSTILLCFIFFIFSNTLDIESIYFIFGMIFIIFLGRVVTNIQNTIMFSEASSKSEKYIEEYNIFISSTAIILNILVPVVAVLLYQRFELSVFKIVLLLMVIIVFKLPNDHSIKVKKKTNLSGIKNNINIFVKNKSILYPIIILNLVFFSAMMISSIYYIFLIDYIHVNNNEYSLFLTVQSLGSLFSSAVLYKKFFRKSIKKIAFLIMIFSILNITFLISSKIKILLLLITFFQGLFLTIILMITNEYFQKNCPKEYFGSLNGIRVTLNNLSGILGSSAGFYIYTKTEVQSVYIVSFILLTIIASISYFIFNTKEKHLC